MERLVANVAGSDLGLSRTRNHLPDTTLKMRNQRVAF